MDKIASLHNYIRDRFHQYCTIDQDKRRGAYRIVPDFQAWEAEFFLRGVERELFYIRTSDGILVYDKLGGETKKNFFYPGSSNTCREAVTQFAALTQLIDQYGYPVESVKAESVEKGDAARYALDALIFDGHRDQFGPVMIAMEAKRDRWQMRRLLRQIDECLARGPHSRFGHDGAQRADHAKYQGILSWEPSYLWLVCPARRESYRVRFSTPTTFTLEPVADIPIDTRKI